MTGTYIHTKVPTVFFDVDVIAEHILPLKNLFEFKTNKMVDSRLCTLDSALRICNPDSLC